MTRPEGWGQRAPRPLILWLGVALVAVCIAGLGVFMFRVGGAIATAYERSAATGEPVPSMDGGLPALLAAMGGLIAGLWPIVQQLNARHVERRDQIARGQAPGPFAPSQPSEPSPTGGLVNDEAIR